MLQSDLMDEKDEPRLRVMFYGRHHAGKSSTINSLARHFRDVRRLAEGATTLYYTLLPLDEPDHSIVLMDTAGRPSTTDAAERDYLGALMGGLKHQTNLKDPNSYRDKSNRDPQLKPHFVVLVYSAADLLGPGSLTPYKRYWVWANEKGKIDMGVEIASFEKWYQFVMSVAQEHKFRKFFRLFFLFFETFVCVQFM